MFSGAQGLAERVLRLPGGGRQRNLGASGAGGR